MEERDFFRILIGILLVATILCLRLYEKISG